MAPLERRSIEWIGQAPVKVAAHAESSASPDQVFAVLADHERWPEWFPAVREVTVIGAAVGVGAQRRVRVPGMTVDEEFIVWEPGRRWAFTGLDARPRITRSLLEDCVLEPLDGGGTSISYTMYLDPPRFLRPLARLLAAGMKRNNSRAMANLARRATELPA